MKPRKNVKEHHKNNQKSSSAGGGGRQYERRRAPVNTDDESELKQLYLPDVEVIGKEGATDILSVGTLLQAAGVDIDKMSFVTIRLQFNSLDAF